MESAAIKSHEHEDCESTPRVLDVIDSEALGKETEPGVASAELEVIGLCRVVREPNKVFEVRTLSAKPLRTPSTTGAGPHPSSKHENSFIGKVTCSLPFSTS